MNNYLSLIKFSHTIFALPFAIVGFFLALSAENHSIDIEKFLLIILCMIFARSAAMAFNRYTDRNIDAINPRTQLREIPKGSIKPGSALAFTLLNAGLFILCTFFINKLCFLLSPIALIVIMGYSYTKRFTALCHLVLGLGLSLAPIGAYLAVTGHFAVAPVLLSLAVLAWVSGFDVIYALQDDEFDRSQQLYSIPVLLGRKNALLLSSLLHVLAAVFILLPGLLLPLGLFYWAGCLIFISLLVYQHLLVKHNDLSRVNQAFFMTNGIASIAFACFFLIDYFSR